MLISEFNEVFVIVILKKIKKILKKLRKFHRAYEQKCVIRLSKNFPPSIEPIWRLASTSTREHVCKRGFPQSTSSLHRSHCWSYGGALSRIRALFHLLSPSFYLLV